jgi:hypothetical protein
VKEPAIDAEFAEQNKKEDDKSPKKFQHQMPCLICEK